MTLTLGGVARGVRRLAPIAAFVVPFGFAYGIAAVDHGMSSLQAIGSSTFVFGGAVQFAILDLWSTDMSVLSVVLVALAVSARHIMFGAALSPWVNQIRPRKRLLAITWLSDPNFADSRRAFADDETDVGILVGGGVALWTCWVIGTAIGAVSGEALADPTRYGVDAVMPVFFASLVIPDLRARSTWAFASVAAFVAVATDPVLPAGWNIVLAALAGGMIGMLHEHS